MKKLEIVTSYFVENVGKQWDISLPATIVERINSFKLSERKALRSRLFNEAKLLKIKEVDFDALDWLQICFDLIDRNTFRIHHVYFSPGYDILDNLRSLVDRAQETLDLCVFSITDERLAKAINRAASRGVFIRIITDDMKTLDRGSKIDWLTGQGIDIRIDHSRYHMHHKFGIVDGRFVFTGSFNWTITASKHNQENLLITSNDLIVDQYSKEYDHLWKEMFDY